MSEENAPVLVFLSYAHADREIASRVQKDLLKKSIAVWRDLENIQAGRDWEELVREAIRTCSGVIYLATPNARGSRIVRGELLLAKTYGKPIYPIWATGQSWPEVASLEDISSHYIDIRASQYEDGLLQLVAFLKSWNPSIDRQREVSNPQKDIAMKETIHIDNEKRRSSGGRRTFMHALRLFFSGTQNTHTVAKASRKPRVEEQRTVIRHRRNPYKGLKAFTTEEAGDFFGREKLIDTMVAEIKHILTLEQRYANRQEPRFLTVVGPSGSGKSSVVMAGLVPSLQQGKVIAGSDTWTFLSPMRPGKDPLEALAQTLLPVLPGNVSMRTILDNLHDESMRALHWYASDIARQQGSRVVLVVDQLEELFTETDETLRQHFIDLLAVATTEPENKVIVIVTMRADFSDHPMKYQLLHRIMEAHRIAIPPMTVENLRAVIERPAFLDDVQVRFEENLVGDLLLDIHGQEENLPLLQFTLEKLFEARHDDLLTLEAYEALGRVQGALSKHAEEVYESLPSEQHHLLAEALFTRLINPGGLEQDATRRRVLRSEFTFADHTQHQQMQETIQTFIDTRLITANEIVSENAVSRRVETVPIIEISHEALISAWKRLADWIKGEHDDIRLRQTLNYDIEQWQERKQHPKFLYSGARLKDGQVWARRNILTEREAKFLEVSRHHQRSKHMRYAFMSIALVMALILILIPVFNFVFPRIFTTIVTNTDDSGPGSLRAAIANASPDSTITFASFVHGNIVLRSDLNIAKRLTLNGPADPGQIVITNRQNRSDKSGEGYNIHIYQNASVTISHLSFKNAFVQQRYFIENQGTLTFDHCMIVGNSSYYNGGAIANVGGSLTLTSSLVLDNISRGEGGGIYSWQGVLTLNDSTVSGNNANLIGGGIYDLGGNVTLNNSYVTDNRTTNRDTESNGGGISILNGILFLNASHIERNTTSGYGGGVTLSGSSGFIDKSVLASNSADQSGGGLAVELNSESNNHSVAVITNMEVTDAPLGTYFIGENGPSRNKEHRNILGQIPLNQNGPMIVNDDSSKVIGTPPPKNPAEKSKEYLGTVNLDRFCHAQYPKETVSLEINTSEEMYCIQQSDGKVIQSPLIETDQACEMLYKQPHLMSRLANYYDPSSWQCYKNEKKLGNITPFLDSFCKSLSRPGNTIIGVNRNTNGTAYDWKCLDQNKNPAELSVGDACQWKYNRTDAFERLVSFNKADGWECWTPA